jgi:glutaredoxin 3
MRGPLSASKPAANGAEKANMELPRRIIEIYGAGCSCCEDMITEIKEAACPSDEVITHDMRLRTVAERAKRIGIRSVPAVLIDGKLTDCCSGGPNLVVLRAIGLGKPK